MSSARISLAPAVDDGTISAERAFCGLSSEDITRLMEQHAELRVLVRLRSTCADGRIILTIRELHAWEREPVPMLIDGVIWYTDEIRDVLALASNDA